MSHCGNYTKNKHIKKFHTSSAPVFIHYFGLCFFRKTVDCYGDVCVFEDLFQNLSHSSSPLQLIQATTDSVIKTQTHETC